MVKEEFEHKSYSIWGEMGGKRGEKENENIREKKEGKGEKKMEGKGGKENGGGKEDGGGKENGGGKKNGGGRKKVREWEEKRRRNRKNEQHNMLFILRTVFIEFCHRQYGAHWTLVQSDGTAWGTGL